MASVEFDDEVKAIYIKFKDEKIAISEPLADNVVIDVDENGEIVGIEVLLPKLDERQMEFVNKVLKAKV